MHEKRRRLQHHLQAAKEWLGKAEASLAAEDDWRSDLNVMLARAELQRIQEIDGGTLAENKRTRWLAPLTALGLALITVNFLSARDEAPPVIESPPVVSRVEERPSQTEPIIVPVDIVAAEEAVLSTAQNFSEQRGNFVPPETKLQEVRTDGAIIAAEAGVHEEVYENVAAELSTGEPVAAAPTKDFALPSAEMQKLMQSAGKILREP